MKKNKGAKHKTTVLINAELWDEFDNQIKPRLGVRDYSPALEILIREWLKVPGEKCEEPNKSRTEGSVQVPYSTPIGLGYSNPELAAIEELVARAWEEKNHSEMARAIISLIRLYGDFSKAGDQPSQEMPGDTS